MSKNIIESICKIVKDTDKNIIKIITQHYQIKGILHEQEKYYDDLLTIEDVEISNLEDSCSSEDCGYSTVPLAKFPIFYLNTHLILGFSLCDGMTDTM